MGVIGTALALATGSQVPCLDANASVSSFVARTASLNLVHLPFIHGAVVPGQTSGSVRFALSE